MDSQNKRGVTMKSSLKKITVCATLLLLSSTLWGQANRSSGIFLRGGFWDVGKSEPVISVNAMGDVSVNRFSGWLVFVSKISEDRFWELSFGATGKIKTYANAYYNDDVHVASLAPILLGIRRYFHVGDFNYPLQPYYCYGGGFNLETDIRVLDGYQDDETTIHSRVKPSLYAGGGLNFHLSEWLAINIDGRYHWINFEKDHRFNGFDFTFGFGIFWGK